MARFSFITRIRRCQRLAGCCVLSAAGFGCSDGGTPRADSTGGAGDTVATGAQRDDETSDDSREGSALTDGAELDPAPEDSGQAPSDEPIPWDEVDVALEEELSEEELAAGQSGDSGIEDASGTTICIWESPDPGPGAPEGFAAELATEPTRKEKLALGAALIEFARDQIPARSDVGLHWVTRAQEAEPYDSLQSFVEPEDTVDETLSIELQPVGRVIIDRCGFDAYLPVLLSFTSSESGINGVAKGFLEYEGGAIKPYLDDYGGVQVYGSDGTRTHGIGLSWDRYLETWVGGVVPANWESLEPPEPEDDEAPEPVPVEDPDGLSFANFPVACEGRKQVSTAEAGGFVSAADLQRHANSLGPIPVRFGNLGTTTLALEVSELVSHTTCIYESRGEFTARVSLVHENGARHEVSEFLDFSPCTERGLTDDPIRSDECVVFEPRVRLELDPAREFEQALQADLGVEFVDPESTINPDSMFCELRLEVTAEGIRSTEGSLCRMWAETEMDGEWLFDDAPN
jgi:hypothetical protein